MFKKSIFLFIFIIFSLLLFKGVFVLAYSLENTNEFLTNTAQISGYEEQDKDFSVIVADIIKTLLTLVGTIFIVLIIYAGFVWMTSGSNSEKVTKARKIMIYSIIGLLIILTAYSITYFIAGRLSGDTTTTPGAPTSCSGIGGACSANCGMWGEPAGSLDCPSSQVCCVRKAQ